MCRFPHLNRYQRAALLVNHAIHGRRVVIPTPASIWAQRIYHSAVYRLTYAACTIGILVLAAWEPPVVVDIAASTVVAIRVIDFAFMGLVSWDLLLQYWYHGASTFYQRGWIRVKAAALVCLFINLIVHLCIPTVIPYVLRVFRPLFLIERLRNVRRVASNIAATVPKILNVVILLCIHVLFFTVLGFVLFAGVDGGNCISIRRATPPHCSTFGNDTCTDYFSTMEDSAMELFQLLTGANFPSVALPAYTCDKLAMLYFFAFIVIGIYLLLSLTLAVTYSSFKGSMAEEVIQKYVRMFEGFDMAFSEVVSIEISRFGSTRATLTTTSNPASPAADTAASLRATRLSPQTPRRLGESARPRGMKKADFVKFFAALRPDVDEECAAKFFQVFDREGTGMIAQKDFRRLILNFGKLAVKVERHSRGQDVNPNGVELPHIRTSITDASPAPGRAGGNEENVPPASHRTDALQQQQLVNQASALNLSFIGGAEDEDLEVFTGVAHDDDSEDEGEEERQDAVGALPGGVSSSTSHTTPSHVANPLQQLDSARSVKDGGLGIETEDEGAGHHETAASPPHSPERPIRVASMKLENPLSPTPSLSSPQPSQPLVSNAMRSLTPGQGSFTTPARLSRSSTPNVRVRSRREAPRIASTNQRVASCRSRGALWLQHPVAALVFDGAILANAVAVMIELGNDADDVPRSDLVFAMRQLQYALLAVFVTEVVLRLYLLGLKPYWKLGWWTRTDIVLVLGAVLGTVLEASGVISRQMSAVMSFFRFLRLIRLLRVLPAFEATVAAFGDILPVMARYATVLFATFYAFAIAGMIAFHGCLDPNSEIVQNTSFGLNGFYPLNFDTLEGALAVNLYLMVLNDWPAIFDTLDQTYGKSARAYFFLFWLTHVILVLNVLVAFVLESFSAQKTKYETLSDIKTHQRGYHLGLDDWRGILLQSGVSFGAYRLSRKAHHFDVYEELYKSEVRSRFPDTFTAISTPGDRLAASTTVW